MKRILAIIMAFVLMFSITALATEEEFSNSANIDYGYDESYDETEKPEDVTSGRSDDVNTSYDEDYDEGANTDITSNKYDDKEQSYNEYYDERVAETEVTPPPSRPTGIKVILNGKQLEFDVEPMLINSRTMVPMRVIFESLGAKVDWDNTTRTAIGKMNKTTIKIAIGKDYLLKNDNIVVLDSPAVIVSGRTLVPVRAIAESLDCKVEWYGETRVVEILK